jgi:hypothetical protein
MFATGAIAKAKQYSSHKFMHVIVVYFQFSNLKIGNSKQPRNWLVYSKTLSQH